jgi:peptidoglycan/LPS O-acetylase OafA/YrhL
MTINAASAMNRPGTPGSPRGTAALAFLGGGAFLSFALLRRRREKLWGMQLGLGLVLLGATLFAGCGGGSGGNTGGTYTLTVTGTSGTLTQTTTYSLTVQ